MWEQILRECVHTLLKMREWHPAKYDDMLRGGGGRYAYVAVHSWWCLCNDKRKLVIIHYVTIVKCARQLIKFVCNISLLNDTARVVGDLLPHPNGLINTTQTSLYRKRRYIADYYRWHQHIHTITTQIIISYSEHWCFMVIGQLCRTYGTSCNRPP